MLAAVLATLMLAPNTSSLWGADGEKYDPSGPLPDWSLAGYKGGEPLPEPEPDATVLDFGATPNDDADDTAAFRRAIDANAGKTVEIPAGRYLLSDRLTIEASDTVLLGAGSGETILHFTRSLEEIDPKASMTGHGTRTTAWSWGGGLIQLGPSGWFNGGTGVPLAADAARGDRTLLLDGNRFAVGDAVFLRGWNGEDPENRLATALYEVPIDPKFDDIDNIRIRLIATVEAVDGDRVTLNRPLPFNLPAGVVSVFDFALGARGIGVRGVTVEFPTKPYRGHFDEDGYNAFEIRTLADGFLADIEIVNADGGIFIAGHRLTIDGLVMRADRETDSGGHTGHHGIYNHGSDNLVTNFDVQTRFIHDLSVGAGSVLNVFSNGRAVDLAMDHHRWAPHSTLWSNLDLGAGTRPFKSGGTSTRGLHSAAGVTFWNLRADRPIHMPSADFAPPRSLFIGVQGLDPDTKTFGRHVESFDGEMTPPDLHAAQRERR